MISGKVKSVEENILLAKTFIKENIFFLMRFESRNITFPEIDHIPGFLLKLKRDLMHKSQNNSWMDEFHKSKDKYKGAATLLVKLIKGQVFWDGNKRTTFLFVNKLLIERHLGILSLNEKTFLKFESLLNQYYNDETKLDQIVKYLCNNCFYNTLDKKLVK